MPREAVEATNEAIGDDIPEGAGISEARREATGGDGFKRRQDRQLPLQRSGHSLRNEAQLLQHEIRRGTIPRGRRRWAKARVKELIQKSYAVSQANRVNYKRHGIWVRNRASTPVFERSLRKCLEKLSFTDDQIQDVIEKTADQGKARNRRGWGARGKGWGRC